MTFVNEKVYLTATVSRELNLGETQKNYR